LINDQRRLRASNHSRYTPVPCGNGAGTVSLVDDKRKCRELGIRWV
jgi:hypothetical protein